MKAKKITKIVVLVLLIMLVFIIVGVGFYAFFATKDTKLDKNALESKNEQIVQIKDVNLKNMEYNFKLKEFVPYEQINPYTVYAFVSLEDKRFFTHNGLDYKRIIGASINNLKAGYYKEGGSTITQQLAKNVFLSSEKSIDRKLKEAKLSLEIEKNYSKEEIITIYLNTIYFGHSIYGIKQASNRLFNKEPMDLSISESAILAGIVKNPLKNSPLNSVDNAISRRNLVLKLMLDQNYIDESEYSHAINETFEKPTIKEQENKQNIPYIQVVISECAKILGISEKDVITKGYEIHTYYDKNNQEILNSAYFSKDLCVNNAEKMFLLADNVTGGVSAYISSLNYSPYEYRRQSASTLKPLVAYAPALEKGLLPDCAILDEKQSFGEYHPKNYQNTYLGWTSLRESLAVSSNICAVKLLNQVGKEYAFDLLNEFGIALDKNDDLATALGGTTYGQTPIELTRAYMTIANGGLKQDVAFIKAIYDRNGSLIYKHNNDKNRVISAESAYFLTDMLLAVSSKGTAKKLNTLPFDVASKTGTCGNQNGNYDAWNMSYTSTHTLCSWYGSADYSLQLDTSISGGSYPTIATKYIYSCLPKPKGFDIPQSVYNAEIDKFSYDNYHIIELASENTPMEYRKNIIVSDKCSLPTSSYFDNCLPNDFNAIVGDGEIIVTLTANDKFSYNIINSSNEVVGNIKKGSGFVEIILPKPKKHIELYYLVSLTDDNIVVKKSHPQVVITI